MPGRRGPKVVSRGAVLRIRPRSSAGFRCVPASGRCGHAVRCGRWAGAAGRCRGLWEIGTVAFGQGRRGEQAGGKFAEPGAEYLQVAADRRSAVGQNTSRRCRARSASRVSNSPSSQIRHIGPAFQLRWTAGDRRATGMPSEMPARRRSVDSLSLCWTASIAHPRAGISGRRNREQPDRHRSGPGRALAVEQGLAELPFEQRLAGNGLDGYAKAFGSAGDAAFLGDNPEVVQVLEIKGGAMSSAGKSK